MSLKLTVRHLFSNRGYLFLACYQVMVSIVRNQAQEISSKLTNVEACADRCRGRLAGTCWLPESACALMEIRKTAALSKESVTKHDVPCVSTYS